MKAKTTNGMQRAQRLEYFRGDAPNWVLIIGGALLSTLSIRCGFKLKGVLDAKRTNDTTPDNRKFATEQRPGVCRLHPNVYSIPLNDGGCHRFPSGDGEKAGSTSPISKVEELSLSLVTIRSSDSSKENDVVPWASSPDRLDLPPRQFHHSNSSDSLCVSECGSDIHSKREVVQKLRHQLKRRDDMIMEMQSQKMGLQNTLAVQMSQTGHLKSQLESVNQVVFNSEREIQRLRKAIADHCVAEVRTPEKPVISWNWEAEYVNGRSNDNVKNKKGLEHQCCMAERPRGDGQKAGMLKEVGKLNEVMEGKELLLQSCEEQKVVLNSKMKELQLRLQ